MQTRQSRTLRVQRFVMCGFRVGVQCHSVKRNAPNARVSSTTRQRISVTRSAGSAATHELAATAVVSFTTKRATGFVIRVCHPGERQLRVTSIRSHADMEHREPEVSRKTRTKRSTGQDTVKHITLAVTGRREKTNHANTATIAAPRSRLCYAADESEKAMPVEESEAQSHHDHEGVPTETAVLRRFWIENQNRNGAPVSTEKPSDKKLAEMLETLIGIELLEYHNMNLLAGDNKRRNETKRAILMECLLLTGKRSDIESI